MPPALSDTVRLSDALLERLQPIRIGAYEVCRLAASLEVPTDAEDGSKRWSGVLEPLRSGADGGRSSGGAAAPPLTNFVSQGDVRLADLRTLLTKAGMLAEFADGALIINRSVRVRKEMATNKLLVEGSYGPDFLHVRTLLYSKVDAV